MRFEQLEERLKKLEVIGLSATGGQEAEKAIERHVTPADGHTGAASSAGEGLTGSEREAIQAHAVQECSERITQLVQAGVEEARLRLRALADEMTPLLQSRVEKMLQKSAGVVVSQVTELLEQEIQIATRRSLYATLGCTKTGAESATAEGGTQATDEAISGQGGKMDQGKFEQELSAALEGIRKQSAAFLESLNIQMQRALEAFEESAAKQMATGFQQIARELHERESETRDTRNEARAAPDHDSSQQQRLVKPQKKETTWRILGLSE